MWHWLSAHTHYAQHRTSRRSNTTSQTYAQSTDRDIRLETLFALCSFLSMRERERERERSREREEREGESMEEVHRGGTEGTEGGTDGLVKLDWGRFEQLGLRTSVAKGKNTRAGSEEQNATPMQHARKSRREILWASCQVVDMSVGQLIRSRRSARLGCTHAMSATLLAASRAHDGGRRERGF
jgi:hypothetical protein